MALWDKVKESVDKVGKAAQNVLDDAQDVLDLGKLRLEAYRARELADKAAEAFGYAVYRAAESGGEMEAAARERLMTALRQRDTEAKRLETQLAAAKAAESDAQADGIPAVPGDMPSHGEAPHAPPPRPDAPHAPHMHAPHADVPHTDAPATDAPRPDASQPHS